MDSIVQTEIGHFVNMSEAVHCRKEIATSKDCARDQVEIIVFGWIGWSFEHVQHSLSYQEATSNVDGTQR